MKKVLFTLAAIMTVSSMSFAGSDTCPLKRSRTNSNRFVEYANKKDNFIAATKHIDTNSPFSKEVGVKK